MPIHFVSHHLLWNRNYTQVPAILIKGKWLEERGFKCGEYVEVEGDKITLTKTTPPEKESPKTISEKIKELDENQLAKLTKFIDKL